jgi:hypothetical protein
MRVLHHLPIHAGKEGLTLYGCRGGTCQTIQDLVDDLSDLEGKLSEP